MKLQFTTNNLNLVGKLEKVCVNVRWEQIGDANK